MKLLWFHLMPYTRLPEDFAEKHASAWVDVDPELFDARVAHALYNEFMDELEHAADQGFDGVCVDEHHQNACGLVPSPNLVAASLARRTSRSALVVMGSSLALYDPPLRVAEEMAMIDCISGGRLVAGFSVGTPMDGCYAYGRNPSTLRDRFFEAHDLILRAWQSDAPFAWNGRFHRLRYVNPWPRPLQEPHPPVWISGGGPVETRRWCAERDYVYCDLSCLGYPRRREAMRGFREELRRLGKDPNPYRAGFLQFVGVAESRDEAMDLYRGPAEYFFGRCLHVDPRFASAPGYTSEATLRAGARSRLGRAAAASRGGGAPGGGPRFEDIVERGSVIVGSPDEVAGWLRRVATELSVGHLVLVLQFGDMDRQLALHNSELFAERVAPQLADLFDDAWEDRWWPRPLAPDERARPREVAR